MSSAILSFIALISIWIPTVLLTGVATRTSNETSPLFTCPLFFDGSELNATYPDSSDPEVYWICIQNTGYQGRCPSGSVFQPTFEYGDCSGNVSLCKSVTSKENAKDTNKTVTTTLKNGKDVKTLHIGHKANTCPSDESGNYYDVTFRDSERCSIYYHCKEGVAWIQVCPTGTVFNPRFTGYQFLGDLQICVPPEHSDCVDQKETKRNVFICPKMNTANGEKFIPGTFLDPQDDRIYWTCVDGEAYQGKCPPGTAFKPKLTSDNTTNFCLCQRNTPPEGATNKGTMKSIFHSTICPMNETGQFYDTTIRSDSNCAVYYHCIDGVDWVQVCPAGTLFGPNFSPHSLDCSVELCVPFKTSGCPVDGNWSEWSAWNPYNGTCTRNRSRTCDNPPPINGGQPCPGPAEEGTRCSSIFVYKTTNWTGYQNPLSLDSVGINRDSDFQGNYFTAPFDGVYFISITAGGTYFKQLIVTLKENTDDRGNIQVLHNKVYYMDTFNRDVLLYLRFNTSLHLETPDGTFGTCGPDQSKLTSMSVFSYTGLFEPMVVFTTGYTENINVTGVIFKNGVVNVNIGGAFSSITGIFTAPIDGLYMFTLSGNSAQGYEVAWRINCTGQCPGYGQVGLSQESNRDRYSHLISRGIMYRLAANDKIWVESTKNDTSLLENNINMQNSFTGFLYAPSTTRPAAFSVTNRDINQEPSQDMDPVPFEEIFVNEGDVFANNTFRCKIPGIYYFKLSTGAPNYFAQIEMWILKNAEPVAAIMRRRGYGDLDTISRSLMLELNSGDTVHVMAVGGTRIYTGFSSRRLLSFVGFLLQN